MACSPRLSLCLAGAGAPTVLPGFPLACCHLHGCSSQGRSHTARLACSVFVCRSATNNLEAVLCLVSSLPYITVAPGLDSAGFIPLFSSLEDAAEWFLEVIPCAVDLQHGGNVYCQGFYSISLTLSNFSGGSYSGEPWWKPSLTFLSAPL